MVGERIMIVEEEVVVVHIYETILHQAGYRTIAVQDGRHALATAHEYQPDLIILDITMPGLHGLEICSALRRIPGLHAIPLVIVTAHAHTEDRVCGLEAGADDYLTKPFHSDELTARVRALLRRAAYRTLVPRREAITITDHTLWIMIGAHSIALTQMEHQLLSYLMRNEGTACSSEQLLREVWKYPPHCSDTGLVRWHMNKLRNKIEPDPQHPCYIHTIRSRGYVYKPS
jgi:DNA-binding response OmpR family regulator